MKVTTEMEWTAAGKLSVDDFGEIAGVRAALEAVLADVPEPGVLDTLRNMLAVQRQRAEEAEAKLTRVREWRANPASFWRELDAILDEEL